MATISDQFKTYDNISKQLDLYNRILKNTMKINVPAYDFSSIYQTIEPFKEQLNWLANQYDMINSSIQPLQDYINSINEMINKSLENTLPKINFEYLNNLKKLSSYASNNLESIDSSLLINTIDEINTSIDTFECDNNSINDLAECKSSFIDLKQIIQNSPLTLDTLYNFFSLLISILALLQPHLDNSTETIIDNQKAIIELQKEQLEVNKDIRDSLKNIQNSSSNTDVIIENISNSLDTLIKSVEE